MRSAEVPWRNALDSIAVDGRHICSQEISDFCSLLVLADQVHVVARGHDVPAATMLTAQLSDFGYTAHGPGRLRAVEATDTVVSINGPVTDHRPTSLDPLVRPATEVGAVLLAIVTEGCSPVLTLAMRSSRSLFPDREDAAVTATWPAPPSTSSSHWSSPLWGTT